MSTTSLRRIESPSQDLPYHIRKKIREAWPQLSQLDRILIFFDGACRGNGLRHRDNQAAAAVFVCSYDCGFTKGRRLPEIQTNNASEICAAIDAAETAKTIADLFVTHGKPIPPIIICGDSNNVIATVKTGKILGFRKNDRMPNAQLWLKLQQTILSFPPHLSTTWQWIPRTCNREADEVANAALDERDYNRAVISAPTPDIKSIGELLHVTITHMTRKRQRTIRTLPIIVSKQVTMLCTQWSHQFDPDLFRKLMLCLPRILSTHQSTVRNRTDFKMLLHHAMLLQDKVYLLDTLRTLASQLAEPSQSTPPSQSNQTLDSNSTDLNKRIATLASRGLYPKILSLFDTNTFVLPLTDNTFAKLRPLFPEDVPQPTPLPTPQSPKTVNWGAILRAHKKLKRGASPGLSGWTRELLNSIINTEDPKLHDRFTTMIEAIINVNISEDEVSLLQSTVGIAFGYYDKPDKARPIQLGETFVKMAFRISIDEIPEDPLYQKTGWTSDTAVTMAALQSAYLTGDLIVCADAVNSFNTASRLTAFAYFLQKRQIYEPLFPLLNMMYGSPTHTHFYGRDGTRIKSLKVETGIRQGCVSGVWFLMRSTAKASSKHFPHLLQIVDDVHIRCKDMDPTRANAVISDFATAGQDLAGSKLYAITSNPSAPPTIKVAEREIKVFTNIPMKIHGGLISPLTTTFAQTKRALETFFTKVERRIQWIKTMPATLQVKCNTLRFLTHYYKYQARTFHSPYRKEIFYAIDELHLSTFLHVSGLILSPSQVPTILTAIEDGGLGMIPYDVTAPLLLTKVLLGSAPNFSRLRIPPFLPQTEQPVTEVEDVQYALTKVLPPSGTKTHLPSWITVWPKTALTRITDDVFRTGLQLTLSSLESFAINCDLESGEHFTKHVLTCAKCSASIYWTRHQKTLFALRDSLTHHGVHCSTKTSDLPLPGNGRGGPDIKIFANELVVGDITVSANFDRDHKLNRAYRAKKGKYKAFENATGIVCEPLVFSHCGKVHTKTYMTISKWLIDRKQATAETIVNCQIKLIEGTAQGLKILKNRTQPTVLNANLMGRSEDESCDPEKDEVENSSSSETEH